MKKIVLLFFVASIGLFAHSQTFEIPEYAFESEEDYERYEQDIVKCVDWLVNTPVNRQNEKRKEASRFLSLWATGTKCTSIKISANITPFVVKSTDFLLMFIGGWSKYAIENKDNYNESDAYIAGIEASLDFYSKNKPPLKKEKNIEKFMKMKEKGTLKEYVNEKLK